MHQTACTMHALCTHTKNGRICCVTLFSGVPNRGDKIRSGYITSAFSGAHKWAELLRNPCVLWGPQKRGHYGRVHGDEGRGRGGGGGGLLIFIIIELS